MKTRCPLCATLFNADNRVLQQSHGLVRCSRCRNVFNAGKHREAGDEKTENISRLPAWIQREIIGHFNRTQASSKLGLQILKFMSLAVLLSLIVVQVAYSQLKHLSQIEVIRPALLPLCQILHCQLSPIRDLSKIDLVDSKITWGKTVQIRLSLRNQAQIDQPYPITHVVMSNYLNQIVAEGYFHPKDYLPHTELFQASDSQEITLMIEDPKLRIRSYEVNFY